MRNRSTIPLPLTLLLLLAFQISALAETPAGLEALPEPPKAPERLQSGQPMDLDHDLEPEITIRPGKDGTVEEYRLNGRLYMLKVTPTVGKPYYLRDTDGDGRFDHRMSQLYHDPVVPQWVIFSWD